MPIRAGEPIRMGEMLVIKDGKAWRPKSLREPELTNVYNARCDFEEGDAVEIDNIAKQARRATECKSSER